MTCNFSCYHPWVDVHRGAMQQQHPNDPQSRIWRLQAAKIKNGNGVVIALMIKNKSWRLNKYNGMYLAPALLPKSKTHSSDKAAEETHWRIRGQRNKIPEFQGGKKTKHFVYSKLKCSGSTSNKICDKQL